MSELITGNSCWYAATSVLGQFGLWLFRSCDWTVHPVRSLVIFIPRTKLT